MRVLVFALLALGALPAPAGAASVESITTGMREFGSAATGADGFGTSAVAYETRRGIVVRVARPGDGYGKPILAASRRRAGRVDGELSVTVGGGRALLAWTRDDRSSPEDPDARDDGCCLRVHAVVVGADGRAGRPRRLSPAGDAVYLGPAVVTARIAVVSWEREYSGPWEMRRHTSGGWGRTRRLLGGRAGDLRYVGGTLTAVGVQMPRQSSSRVVRRTISASGRLSAPRRIASWSRASLLDLDLRLDGIGRTTGVLETYSEPGNRDALISQGRARRLGLTQGETALFDQASNGAAAILAVSARSRRTARIRVRPSGGAPFGPWRKVKLARRGYVHDFATWLAVRSDGSAAILSLPSPGNSALVLTRVGADGRARRPRTLRSYRGAEPAVAGLRFDERGRPVALVKHVRRLELVRP